MRLAIEQPRFDQAPIDRIRAQIVAGIIANARDPETAAQVQMVEGALRRPSLFAGRDEGTEQSLATITADDLKALHHTAVSPATT